MVFPFFSAWHNVVMMKNIKERFWGGKFDYFIKMHLSAGCLGGSVGWAADFCSGHDLVVREFEPRVGLCADSSEPEPVLDSVSPSL